MLADIVSTSLPAPSFLCFQVQRENLSLHHPDRPPRRPDPGLLQEGVREAAVLLEPLQPRPRHRQVLGELLRSDQNQIQWVSVIKRITSCTTAMEGTEIKARDCAAECIIARDE